MKKQILLAMVISLLLITPASALTLDSINIVINDDGSATIDSHYELSLMERIMYKWLTSFFGDEKQLIESKLSEVYGGNAEVEKLNKNSNTITVTVSDFVVEKSTFKDGYWMNYTGIEPKPGLTIKDVRTTFPDGYVKTYNGKIPSDVHFVNDELTSYYYRTQYYQTLYEKSYGIYDPNNYKLETTMPDLAGKFITSTGIYGFVISTGVKAIGVSALPQDLQWISNLMDVIEIITKSDSYTKLKNSVDTGIIGKFVLESGFKTYMGPAGDIGDTRKKISDTMKELSELKAQEAELLEKSLSEKDGWYDNLDALIANLNDQKNTLTELKEASDRMAKDVQGAKEDLYFSNVLCISQDGVSYIESISELAQFVSEIDYGNVEDELEYLKNL